MRETGQGYQDQERGRDNVIQIKLCHKCGILKAIDEFACNRSRKGGRQVYCRKCQNGIAQAWADNHRSVRRRHQQVYSKRNPDARAETMRRSKERCAKSHAAKRAVRDAVRSGVLIPEPCGYNGCGSLDVEGHHHDYDKPLDVWWRCPEHHRPIYHRRKD
jgi:hypothetical protein